MRHTAVTQKPDGAVPQYAAALEEHLCWWEVSKLFRRRDMKGTRAKIVEALEALWTGDDN